MESITISRGNMKAKSTNGARIRIDDLDAKMSREQFLGAGIGSDETCANRGWLRIWNVEG
jgi:hypothetical protein